MECFVLMSVFCDGNTLAMFSRSASNRNVEALPRRAGWRGAWLGQNPVESTGCLYLARSSRLVAHICAGEYTFYGVVVRCSEPILALIICTRHSSHRRDMHSVWCFAGSTKLLQTLLQKWRLWSTRKEHITYWSRLAWVECMFERFEYLFDFLWMIVVF